MKYLVILDNQSIIGRIYAKGNNDGYVSDGTEKHPVLSCTEVVTDNPCYVFAKRDLSGQGKSHQSLHIPHTSVVAIYHYADEGSKPMGFIAPDGSL